MWKRSDIIRERAEMEYDINQTYILIESDFLNDTIILPKMLMYGKEASNRKQEIDRQHHTIPRCFATPNRYIKSETLNLSALAEFFYVNICVFLCCIVLRFT